MKPVLAMNLLLAMCVAAGADNVKREEPSAASLLTSGLAKAKENKRHVFLLFGSPG